MIRADNTQSFKEAIEDMMAKRNGKRKNRARKYYIQSVETDEHIIVQNYYRFKIEFKTDRRNSVTVWSDIVVFNKSTDTVTLYDGGCHWKKFKNINISNMIPKAIADDYDGESKQTYFNLNNLEMRFLKF